MIDFNMWEITALVALAIVVFGPEKLPELARKTARVLAYLRRIGNDARGQLRQELGPEFDDIKLSDLNPKSLVARHLLSGEEVDDLRQLRDEALATGQLVRDTVNEAGSSPTTAAAVRRADGVREQAESPASVTFDAVPFDPEAT
ncbi:MAG: Sec-independent protein translocase subunit TatB [Actinomycetes bacterium]